jgi:hypothetical protein
LLAWLQGQTLSYMLTLTTILLFGLVLGNMENLVGHLARPIQQLIGYRPDQTGFALETFSSG